MKKVFTSLLMVLSLGAVWAQEGFPIALSPTAGSEVEKLQVITITSTETSSEYYFETVENISESVENFEYAGAKAYFKCGEEVVNAKFSSFPDLYITANQALTSKGEYTLVIEKGAIQWGEWNEDYTAWTTKWTNEEDLTYTYIVKGTEEEQPEQPAEQNLPFTLDPEAGSTVASLESVTLNFGVELDSDYCEINPWNVYFAKNGEKYNEGKIKSVVSGSKITVSPASAITEAGEYELIFKANSLDLTFDSSLEGFGYYYKNNQDLSFKYTVSGSSSVDSVTSISVNDGIYNLYGVKVADTIGNLTPGIYIVNGKKVVVK